jgi:hypothetical protein
MEEGWTTSQTFFTFNTLASARARTHTHTHKFVQNKGHKTSALKSKISISVTTVKHNVAMLLTADTLQTEGRGQRNS